MRQKTFAFHDSYDAVTFLDGIQASADYADATAVLVTVFTDRCSRDYIAYIAETVKSRLPKARLSGLTCMAGFAYGEELHSVTVLAVSFFFRSEVEVLEYDLSALTPGDVEYDLLARLGRIPDLKGIQAYTTSLRSVASSRILSAVSAAHDGIPVFGAGAGYPEQSEQKQLYVFGSDVYEDGLVVTLFSGKQLRIFAESTLGWTPIGKEMIVTAVRDGHILQTLDGEIAGDVYKKYLGVSAAERFVENTCEFPFMLRRGGKWIARMPIRKDADGYIHFAADIAEGEKLVFSYGAKNIILKQAFNLAEYLSRKDLEGILLCACRNRHIYLKDEEILELQAFSNFYREACGCFSFAEILYKDKSGGVQNSALVAAGFLEVDDAEAGQCMEDCFIEDMRHGNSGSIDFGASPAGFSGGREVIPFEERIVNFLHATTRDLNLANAKLEEAATTDGLTKLLNRKKIGECIELALKARRESAGTNLIMFDIDNFKRINDTYGHDKGDEVLCAVARTAGSCIRSHDKIGRWGGEEFMLLIADATKETAAAIAERIRAEINSIPWEDMPAVSVSVGVTALRDGDDSQTLYKRVDNRLYYAKTHGKNRVVSGDEA